MELRERTQYDITEEALQTGHVTYPRERLCILFASFEVFGETAADAFPEIIHIIPLLGHLGGSGCASQEFEQEKGCYKRICL